MNYDMAIAVRISSDKDAEIIEQINCCEGKTFSDRFRTYLRRSVEEGGE